MTVAVLLPEGGPVGSDRRWSATLVAAHKLETPVECHVVGQPHDLASYVSRIFSLKGTATEESVAGVIAKRWKAGSWTHLFLPATPWGRALGPRIAALVDAVVVSDVSAIRDGRSFDRVTHAGRVLTTVRVPDSRRVVVTVRPTSFQEIPAPSVQGSVEELSLPDPGPVSLEAGPATSDEQSLISARRVVVAGRGVASQEGMSRMEELASLLGAAIGATRAVCDLGFLPSDRQVGQTGKVIAPDVYLGVGVSGAVQHLAGIKDSKIVAAINSDPEAPIFEHCDLGVVARWEDVLDELITSLKERGR